MSKFLAVVTLGLAVVSALGCSGRKENDARPAESKSASTAKPNYAFFTNGIVEFWEHARAGTKQAAQDLDVDVTYITPSSMTDQTRKIEDLLTRGTDGIAISPIDPVNQVEILNKAAAQTNLITHDSDAPATNRVLYIGMDNYDAGLLAGSTLRKAMPEGGAVMIFIGRLDQDNAKRRRQGFIDGLFDRKPDANRRDELGVELKSDDGKYTVLGTMTDQFDFSKAKANVEDAVTRYPDIAGMVGMFEYNPPLILEALTRADKLGKVKVLGFDENPATLQGIQDGNVVATVVQNPFQYGYKSIEMLHELHKGNKSAIPESKFINIPARVIDATNVETFSKQSKEELGRK